jgi:hypothetical protein
MTECPSFNGKPKAPVSDRVAINSNAMDTANADAVLFYAGAFG